jgi:hypothetical protein
LIDYATKYCLAVTIGPTSRALDAVVCLHAAIAEAERVTGLDDLRDDRGLMDIVDPDEYVLGQVPAPIAVITDNGAWAGRWSIIVIAVSPPGRRASGRRCGLRRRRRVRSGMQPRSRTNRQAGS